MRSTIAPWLGLPILAALLGMACAAGAGSAPPRAATASLPASAPAAAAAASEQAPAAEASALPPRPERPVEKVTIGVTGNSTDVVLYLAEEKGYFAHMRIEPQFERFDSGGRMVASLATNQIQVAGGAPSVGLYNAIARRVDVKMVADRASGAPGYFLFVRKDLLDSGAIRDYADLRGRRIAVAAMGTTAEVVVGRALEKAGLALADAEIVEIPYTDMLTALSTGAIDIGVAPEPTPTIAQQQGVAIKWHNAQEIVGNQQGSVLMYTGSFVDESPSVARDFMVAYLLGARLYNDAFVKRLPEAVASVRDTILRRTTLRDPALLDQGEPVQTDPNGVMNRPGLAADYQWFREYGGLTETVDLDSLVDERYIQYAQSVLGLYR
jgi:NitT/TauT family transport system substrate-binding protein